MQPVMEHALSNLIFKQKLLLTQLESHLLDCWPFLFLLCAVPCTSKSQEVVSVDVYF